ncbi:MAG: hypothetical protein GY776_07005 [Alteromonas sp.]|nr:hypothetical protein [Alteromonas sp.]
MSELAYQAALAHAAGRLLYVVRYNTPPVHAHVYHVENGNIYHNNVHNDKPMNQKTLSDFRAVVAYDHEKTNGVCTIIHDVDEELLKQVNR